MSLDNVWLNVDKEIGFFTKATFYSVPSSPGVYAWFYPLRVISTDPYEFLSQVSSILNYDATINDKPKRSTFLDFTWHTIDLNIELNFQRPNLNKFISIWNEAINDTISFDKLRRIIMKASIFMPPLYVGKTKDLNIRCIQHVNGNDRSNDFNSRYTSYAKKNKLVASKVSDLLFVCIRTKEETNGDLNNTEELIEAIIKHLAKPVYSIK